MSHQYDRNTIEGLTTRSEANFSVVKITKTVNRDPAINDAVMRGLKPTLLTDSRLGQARGPDLLSYFSIRVLGVFDKWLILQDRLLVTG